MKIQALAILVGLSACQERRTSAYGVESSRMQGVYLDNRPTPNILTIGSDGRYVLRRGRDGRETTGRWKSRFEVHGPNDAEETIRFHDYFSDPGRMKADWIVKLEFCGKELCFYEDYDSGITFRRRAVDSKESGPNATRDPP